MTAALWVMIGGLVAEVIMGVVAVTALLVGGDEDGDGQ
jgi:hypothetical protein